MDDFMKVLLEHRNHHHSLVQKATEQVQLVYNIDSQFICEKWACAWDFAKIGQVTDKVASLIC